MSADTEATEADRLAEILSLAISGAWPELQAAVIALVDEVERLREFTETVIAACVPMKPPADNPVPPVIASVFVALATKALGRAAVVETQTGELTDCSVCGHLHFDTVQKVYVRCPLAPKCDCILYEDEGEGGT